MGFLNSFMLWGLLAVSVPLAIHLIHRRRALRVPFPAIEFILRSRKAVAKRFRLKQILLLALRCLLVAAVAMAAARPLFAGRNAALGPSGGPAAVAIAIDTSLSMRARGDGKTNFDAARDAALSLVKSLGPDVEAVIVPFGADAKTVPSVPTADKVALSEALNALEPEWTTTGIGRALDTAAQAIASSTKPRKAVYVFTDGAAPGWSDVMPRAADSEISWRLVDVAGESPANLAVISLEVRPEGTGPVAQAEVQSFSVEPKAGVAVEMFENDRQAGRNFVDLSPGSTAGTTFTLPSSSSGLNVTAARIEPDALEADDTRHAVFRGRSQVRTLLVDGDPKVALRDAETFYLERALSSSRRAASSVVPVTVDAEGLARADLAKYDVVVLANVGTLPGQVVSALKRWVSNGGGLFFAVGDRVEAGEANATFGDLLPMRLRGVRSSVSTHSEGGADIARVLSIGALPGVHPITELLDDSSENVLGSTRFTRTQLLEGGAGEARTVLKFSDGSPALIERPYERGRIALLASTLDREWTDLPIATAYLPLMRRTLLFLAGQLGETGDLSVLVGRPVQIEVGEHEKVRVEGPDSFKARIVSAADGVVEIVPTVPGIYRLSRTDGTPDDRLATKGFAANLDTSESDLRKVTDAELARIFENVDFIASGGVEGSGRGAPSRATPDQPFWGMLLGLGLLALLLEGAVSQL